MNEPLLPLKLEPGELYQLRERWIYQKRVKKWEFSRFNDCTAWGEKCIISVGEPLLLLRKTEIYESFSSLNYGYSAVAMSTALTSDSFEWPATSLAARSELEKTGKIEGYLFLAPESQQIWISHYEAKNEYLEHLTVSKTIKR